MEVHHRVALEDGGDPYIVTSLGGDAGHLYEDIYCARGQAENLIKLHKGQLASDRTSCQSPIANQFRLVLHTAAYWLMLGEHGGARIAEYGPGDALEPRAAFEDHVAGVDVAATEPCRTVLMTASARQSLERDDLVLAHELSKHLIGVMLARQTRLSG